jgi:hypothetical protein
MVPNDKTMTDWQGRQAWSPLGQAFVTGFTGKPGEVVSSQPEAYMLYKSSEFPKINPKTLKTVIQGLGTQTQILRFRS